MRSNFAETTDERRSRISYQAAAAQRANDLAAARRLSLTAEGRQLLAEAIDEGREQERATTETQRQHFLLVA